MATDVGECLVETADGAHAGYGVVGGLSRRPRALETGATTILVQ